MNAGKCECASNGEEKMGSIKKEAGHLFFSILPIMFPRKTFLSLERRGK